MSVTRCLRGAAAVTLSLAFVLSACVVPRLIWPQDDILGSEINPRSSEKSVLIASRASEFKGQVVERLRLGLETKPVYVKIIGLDGLEGEDAARYDAVVLINTCMAWGLDPKVDGFLKRQKQQSHVVVLTTSGNGTWMPGAEGRTYDAIASASKRADADKIADAILERVDRLLLQD
jgi:hypothetical protein